MDDNSFTLDELFIKKEFEKHYSLFEKHLSDARKIENYESIWSNAFLPDYPYQAEMNQLPAIKIFRNKPKEPIDKMENRLINNKVYFAWQFDLECTNAIFHIDDGQNQLKLHYVKRNNKIILGQIHCLIIENSIIRKNIYFMTNDMNMDTFMTDEYIYNENNKVQYIVREGYYNGLNNILPTRTFRFEYEDTNVIIYSKQLKLNGDLIENQISKTQIQ